jgi:hypothetical protein
VKKIIPLAMLTLCATAHALPIIGVEHGFLTGTDYKKGNPGERASYVMGVVDGFYYSPIFGAPYTKIDKVQICLDKLAPTAAQVAGIVDHYMETNPGILHDQMQPIVLGAIRNVCAARGTPID